MNFKELSIFSRHAAIQLLKNAAAPSADCAVCLAACGGERVCRACDRAMPRSPVRCPGCALPMPEAVRCGQCLVAPPAFDATWAAFDYAFPLDRLVHRFKFGGDLALGRWLGEALAGSVGEAERPDLLVASPLARVRLRARGFNQAVELARIVGSARRVPLDLAAIGKVRETPPQQGLGRDQRRVNLRDAFVARPLRGEHVAIVDDVMTTGATADAIAGALKRAGARRVSVWVLARTP